MKIRTAASSVSSVADNVSSSLSSSLGARASTTKSRSGGVPFRKALEKIARQKQAEKQENSEKAAQRSSSSSREAVEENEVSAQDDAAQADQETSVEAASSSQEQDAAQSADNNTVGQKRATRDVAQHAEAQDTAPLKNKESKQAAKASIATIAGRVTAASLEAMLAAFLQNMNETLGCSLPAVVTQQDTGTTSSAAALVNGASARLLVGVLSTAQASVSSVGSTTTARYAADPLSVLAKVQQGVGLGAGVGSTSAATAAGNAETPEAVLKAAKEVQALADNGKATVTVAVGNSTLQRAQNKAKQFALSNAVDKTALPYRAEVSSITLGLQQATIDQTALAQAQKTLSGASEQLASELAGLVRNEGWLNQNAGLVGEYSEDSSQEEAGSQENTGDQLAANAQLSASNFSSLLEAHSESAQGLPTQQGKQDAQNLGASYGVTTTLYQPSADDGTLSMMIMMGESAPVTVRVENSDGVTTGIILETGDPDIVRHLSGNKHELIEALGAAGLDASTMKIDIVASTQNTDSSFGHNQESGQQNLASGGGDTSGSLFGGMTDRGAGQNNGGNAWRPGSVFGAHEVRETEATDAGVQRSAWSRDGRVINITA